MAKFNEVEFKWVQECLELHGEFLVDLLQETIERKKLKKSGDLESSLDFRVGNYGDDLHLELSFYSYGRAIEIRNNSKNSQTLSEPRSNQFIWGIRSNSKKKTKSKDARWYARNVYGSFNRLISIMQNEFSQEEITRIKGYFTKKNIAI